MTILFAIILGAWLLIDVLPSVLLPILKALFPGIYAEAMADLRKQGYKP
jgi:hypothetical protein